MITTITCFSSVSYVFEFSKHIVNQHQHTHTHTHTQFVATTILSVFYILRKQSQSYPPTYNPAYLPLLGGFLEFAKDPLEALRRGYKRCGDCFTINMMGKRMTFLVGPEAHEVFFKASDDELSQEEVYKFMIPVFGKGVVYVEF